MSVKKDENNKIVSYAKAHILVDGKKKLYVLEEGNGPVNALR